MPLTVGFAEKVAAQGGVIIGIVVRDTAKSRVNRINTNTESISHSSSANAESTSHESTLHESTSHESTLHNSSSVFENIAKDTINVIGSVGGDGKDVDDASANAIETINSTPDAKPIKELIIRCKCAKGHEWEGNLRKLSKKWCTPCTVIASLKERFQTTTQLCDPEWSYQDKCFTMTCKYGHRFVVETHTQQHGCHVCSTLRTVNAAIPRDRKLMIAGDIVCRMRKTILAWKCGGCGTTFSAAPETLLKHVGIKKCPHAIKFGGIHSNGIISKNIIESVFMRQFDDPGVVEFGKRGPTAYNANLKLAIHYTDPKETAWNRLIVNACRENNINLVKVNHTKWAQESLLRHIIEKLALYVDIPDMQFIIDELMPGMFLTIPRYIMPCGVDVAVGVADGGIIDAVDAGHVEVNVGNVDAGEINNIAATPQLSPQLSPRLSPQLSRASSRASSPQLAQSMQWTDPNSSTTYNMQYTGASFTDWESNTREEYSNLSGDEVFNNATSSMGGDNDNCGGDNGVISDTLTHTTKSFSIADSLNQLLYESD